MTILPAIVAVTGVVAVMSLYLGPLGSQSECLTRGAQICRGDACTGRGTIQETARR